MGRHSTNKKRRGVTRVINAPLIHFEYCPILGLKWYEIKELKTKYLDGFNKNSKFIK